MRQRGQPIRLGRCVTENVEGGDEEIGSGEKNKRVVVDQQAPIANGTGYAAAVSSDTNLSVDSGSSPGR
jgi:hypothetical protein